ncbi:MAG TPA: hypothetical protein VND93_23145 [Myxococcales bacterium]|jgi:hypothetical protein|nr:hypothetical protein [Myxococcales bacterium]
MRLAGTVAACALALCAGCGPRYARKVPGELVAKLPYEVRIELLEAENDLGVAVDQRDEAENEVLRTRNAIRRARDRKTAAEREVGEANDAVSREVARLAVDEAGARIEYLRARQDANVAAQERDDLALECAWARYELAKLNAARKAKVEGAEKLPLKDFEEQPKQCQADVVNRQLRVTQEIKKAETARADWDSKKSALAKKTFDTRASPYVE